MLDIDTALGWRGKTVRDRDGEKVGTLGDIYLEGESDRPAYAGVLTGLFKRHESIVPLADAREVDGDLVIPYEAAVIREAPHIDPDVALTDEEEDRLRGHYGEATQMAPDSAEMVRSEEEVDFGVAPAQPKERVRLRKHTVVEHVKTTVPVRREEIRVEHDPPQEGRIVHEEDL